MLGAASGFTAAEAIDLLMRVWSAQSPYTWKLTLAAIETLLAQTAQARAAFDGRDVATLDVDEVVAMADIYAEFQALLGPVGAAKALGLLNPRVFPLWDTAIGIAYIGHKWSQDGAPPAYYGTFVGYCILRRKPQPSRSRRRSTSTRTRAGGRRQEAGQPADVAPAAASARSVGHQSAARRPLGLHGTTARRLTLELPARTGLTMRRLRRYA